MGRLRNALAVLPTLIPGGCVLLLGDPAKAKAKLGWTPKCSFRDLVRLMVDADMQGDGRPVRPRG